ncbi:MFS transporter [Actinacidiphila paucisporea]|uniref:Drug resistance transporter, EmrB/QacA subfamily n=1 Tax=Actinacidiphila paucisporea TaxID=310782 RepID=A0A1M6UFU5_9ACTN|nr:MFS transporter [Actinacidiphila paucisporea]SHK68056.1 drug resistance transporter, EmrB/QacA subfamily [Actinacidiphila paucisporea]
MSAPSTAPPQPDPRRWLALIALCLSMLVLSFDTTILNVALPTMAGSIGAGTGDMQWIVDSYTVVFAAAMLPAGLLGDRFGRRRMLVAGLAVFLVGSVLGSLVDSPGPVIAARTVMGLGGAFVMPLALSVIPSLFGPAERPKAVALASTAVAFGMPLGPIIGGTLLQHFWWGSVFLVNIPLIALAVAACYALLPETTDPAAPRVRVSSTFCSVLGLGALVYGIIEAPNRGWGDPLVVAVLAAGAVLLAALVLRERTVERPMLDMSLLRQRAFLGNAVAATLVSFILTGMVFVLPSYLQSTLGYDAFGTGLRLLPMLGGLMVAARLSPYLAARSGPRPVIVAGLLALAAGAFLGATTASGDGYGGTALWLAIAGAGLGLVVVQAMNSALGALPRERAGSGSGLLQTLRQTGAAIGVAILGSVLAAGYTDRLDTAGLSPDAAHTARESVVGAHAVAARLGDRALAASADTSYLHGMDLALVACGAASLVTALLLAALLPNPRPDRPAAAAPAAPADAMAEQRADARQ